LLFIFFIYKFQGVDIWREASCPKCGADVKLSPLVYDDVISMLNVTGYETTTIIDDVQLLIDSDRPKSHWKEKGSFDYSKYHDMPEVSTI